MSTIFNVDSLNKWLNKVGDDAAVAFKGGTKWPATPAKNPKVTSLDGKRITFKQTLPVMTVDTLNTSKTAGDTTEVRKRARKCFLEYVKRECGLPPNCDNSRLPKDVRDAMNLTSFWFWKTHDWDKGSAKPLTAKTIKAVRTAIYTSKIKEGIGEKAWSDLGKKFRNFLKKQPELFAHFASKASTGFGDEVSEALFGLKKMFEDGKFSAQQQLVPGDGTLSLKVENDQGLRQLVKGQLNEAPCYLHEEVGKPTTLKFHSYDEILLQAVSETNSIEIQYTDPKTKAPMKLCIASEGVGDNSFKTSIMLHKGVVKGKKTTWDAGSGLSFTNKDQAVEALKPRLRAAFPNASEKDLIHLLGSCCSYGLVMSDDTRRESLDKYLFGQKHLPKYGVVGASTGYKSVIKVGKGGRCSVTTDVVADGFPTLRSDDNGGSQLDIKFDRSRTLAKLHLAYSRQLGGNDVNKVRDLKGGMDVTAAGVKDVTVV